MTKQRNFKNIMISDDTARALHAAKQPGESYHGVIRRLLGLEPIGGAIYIDKIRALKPGERIKFEWRYNPDGSVIPFYALQKAKTAVARQTGWVLYDRSVGGGWEIYRHA